MTGKQIMYYFLHLVNHIVIQPFLCITSYRQKKEEEGGGEKGGERRRRERGKEKKRKRRMTSGHQDTHI